MEKIFLLNLLIFGLLLQASSGLPEPEIPADVMRVLTSTLILPDRATLNYRLRREGLDRFLEKTGLDRQLGSQVNTPLGVTLSVDYALNDYQHSISDLMRAVMFAKRPVIIRAILQEHPDKISALERVKLLKGSDV